MKQKRVLALILSTVLLLTLLAGCTQKPTEQTETTTAVEAPAVTEPAPAEKTHLHSWEITTEEEARDYYVGQWKLYEPGAYGDVLSLTLAEDDTFAMEIVTDENGQMSHYSGTWEIEMYEDGYLACAVNLHLQDTDDDYFAQWESIGTFAFEELSHCDGELLANMHQLNNGDSVYTIYCTTAFENPNTAVLHKPLEDTTEQERRTNDTFYAHMWKSRYGDQGQEGDFGFGQFVVYVDDVELQNETQIINDVITSVPYIVGDDEDTGYLSGGPDGLYPYGSDVYRLTTDADGVITSAEYICTDPAPTEEEAFMLLQNYDEVRLMMEEGMTMLYDGQDSLFGVNVAMVSMGTNHEDNFVREVQYAITPYSDVYRLDMERNEWYWVDPSAMG